jgi:dolichol-phosphate mannosyltransferase
MIDLSVVIPAHNEEGCIESTVRNLHHALLAEPLSFEILVVNDNSKDRTEEILKQLGQELGSLRVINNTPPNGFGFAIRKGLEHFKGEAVAIYMADASDLPKDLIKFYRTMKEHQVDCVFGSRFMKSSKVIDYPFHKLFFNRLGNWFIQLLFQIRYNDVTNAFKLYHRRVIVGVQPILSYHFNLTVELPLKAIVRGFSYKVVSNSWINRKEGIAKFKIKEMGSRYFFIVFYCFIERLFSRGDYSLRKNHKGRD